MTNLFNPTIAIPAVWEMLENIPSRPDALAIGGGTVADHFYNEGSRDIDVFVSCSESTRVQLFCDYYKFTPVIQPEQFREVEDSYGELRRVRIGKQESSIMNVYKGHLLGYPVEIILVKEYSVSDYITTMFDQSVKSCWYNGSYHYGPAFMETATSGIIEPIRQEASGYVRAWLSADKYNLELSSMYELSKHYCSYGFKHQKLEKILSASTISKIEGIEDKLFNFKIDKANVVLMDIFMNHHSTKTDLYRKLCKIADKEVVTRHPLHGKHVDIKIKSTVYKDFITELTGIHHEILTDMNGALSMEHMEAIQAVKIVGSITGEQFVQGVCIDNNHREARIGRYLMKIQRKYKEIFANPNVQRHAEKAMKLLETRGVVSKARVYITGSKYALTHISTKTEWTSCQRWGGYGSRLTNNYGLLANVSGSSLVAYVADEPSDNESSNWKARILIRIGQDGSLFLEPVYSGRTEYQNDNLRKAVQEGLAAQGYTVIMAKEEVMDFHSLPMWIQPYNDCYGIMKVTEENGHYVFRGMRAEIEREMRIEALSKALNALTLTITPRYKVIDEYTQQAIITIPDELQEEARVVSKSGFYFQIACDNQASGDHTQCQARLDEVNGRMVLEMVRQVPWNRRVGNNHAPHFIAVPVVAQGADHDGDNGLPF